jgi:hypothetical protein
MTKFPRILAAWKQIELDQWELGDALIEECGEPLAAASRRPSINTGDYDKIEEAAEFLEQYGFDHGVRYLARLRQTAFDFPPNKRKVSLSWGVHEEAGSPERLAEIKAEAAEQGVKVTRDFVREQEGLTPSRKDPPKATGQAREPERDTSLSWLSDIMAKLHGAEADMDWVTEALDERPGTLSQTNIDAIAEIALSLSMKTRNIADVARKFSKNKRSHLAAVGE